MPKPKYILIGPSDAFARAAGKDHTKIAVYTDTELDQRLAAASERGIKAIYRRA